MPADPSELYGVPRPRRKGGDKLPSSTSNAFASHLTSLISTPSSTAAAAAARPRPSKPAKEDIFTAHSRAAKKRKTEPGPALEQQHSTSLPGADEESRRRAQLHMEEKARLYAAMKRGDYIPGAGSRRGAGGEAEPLVDFDRKWAEGEKEPSSGEDEEEEEAEEEEELVEYEDELGRTRKGTKAQAQRERARQRAAAQAAGELAEMRGRRPREHEAAEGAADEGLIRGDTIQHLAFDPDAQRAEQIASLAAKRDRSLTPPDELHYDASKEVRSKGVGFYQFSQDKETREREMGNLAKEREETEKLEAQRRERREKKEREKEERRKLLRQKRGEKEADKFLESLG